MSDPQKKTCHLYKLCELVNFPVSVDSKIYFNRSPFPMINYKILEPSRLNYDQVWYQPFKGLLLVFKSDTLHMVEKKVTDDVRISLSYNFKGV